MKNANLTPRSTPIGTGEPAPDFTLLDQNRKEWKLSEAVKTGDVVLCFYPLAFTSVCSTEMNCVNEEITTWSAKGAQVVGISCDSFATQKAWADSLGLKQTLLADMHREVCKAYGLYWPDLNVSSRGTVVIRKDPGGVCKVRWAQARQPGNAMNFDEVLASLA